jgi:DNA-binding LacI/PurR family transcriptional regulator
MTKKTYTIVDLANLLGISKSTVSRALRDQYDVNPTTREKVLALARSLDFQSNHFAAGLRGNQSFIIGVIIPSFSIPFYSIALEGIQQVASQYGYNLIVCQTGESFTNEESAIRHLTRSRVDGLLISLSKDTPNAQHLLKLKQRGVPVVLFNRVVRDADLPRVLIDDYTGARDAVSYLVGRGHRDIAHISGPCTLMLGNEREQGYLDALREAGMESCRPLMARSDFSIESGKKAMLSILNGSIKPDAVFCVCDAVAFGAMEAIKGKGLRIPDDISVMGFTDEPFATLVTPSLSTVCQPIKQIGEMATSILLEYIRDIRGIHNRKEEILETRLIIRDSTR